VGVLSILTMVNVRYQMLVHVLSPFAYGANASVSTCSIATRRPDSRDKIKPQQRATPLMKMKCCGLSKEQQISKSSLHRERLISLSREKAKTATKGNKGQHVAVY
jgi:hypothetical protein